MITSGILATVMLAKAAMRARKARKQAPSQSSLLFEDWNINFNLPPKLITRCAVCWRRRSAKGYWCQYCESRRFRENFSSWTSGNRLIDDFIQETQLNSTWWAGYLEWIPFKRFQNVEFIAQGGFGSIYSALWVDGPRWEYVPNAEGFLGSMWKRKGACKVALKMLDNSKDIRPEFLHELRAHYKCLSSGLVLTCYGITQHPDTKDYMMVMDYAKQGDLTHFLRTHMANSDWYRKVRELWYIAQGLKAIHDADLVHKDFHSGNILFNTFTRRPAIGDLGLCRPVNEGLDEKPVFGVLPYVAPEILLGKPYTKASDIYSFSMVMYEVSTLKKPYYNFAHDASLALDITKGLRPQILEGTPKQYVELMKLCWQKDPIGRPSAAELVKKLEMLLNDQEINNGVVPTIHIDENYHPDAVYTSRALQFPDLKNAKFDSKFENMENDTNVYITRQFELSLENLPLD
ncbi:kinase-like domain-containing protein [Gigaspora rosea]|uniref:Kinase-like domain-containing protein n=1 Tax=Gigaspora rosea TaxID=44941 RepID=A0A397VUT3_9GLOM|nr:kinase-like domain-containing protein [Gigaspora rosea]